MAYYLRTTVDLPFDDAIVQTREALKAEGFGVMIGVDFRRYTILGACNPGLAYEALQHEDKVGTMLPCNVVVQETGPNRTEIAAIDPVASMQAIENPRLHEAADTVRGKLQRVVDSLASGQAQRS